MSSVMQFLIIGLGLGGVYALLSQGMVLIYRGSGVLNLAQGAIAYLAATVYYELHIIGSDPAVVSAVCGIAASAVAGVVIQVGIMRPMRKASAFVRLLATLGLMVTIESFIDWRTADAARLVSQFLPHGALQLPGRIVVGTDRVIIFGIAIAVTGSLAAFYGYTRFGLVTTAAAENDEVAEALGHSANRIAFINWVLGSSLAGLAGILVAPIVGLSPGTLTLLVVPALACTLVGDFKSFWLTLVGASVIGAIQSELARFVSFPGWSDALPFAVIIVMLFLRGHALPLRRHLSEALPRVGSGAFPLRLVPVLVIVAAAITSVLPGSWQVAASTTFIGMILCLSVVVITGLAGQLSLCQMGLAGMAAWAAGRLTVIWHLPFVAALLVGTLLMVPLGLVVGIPALRTRGVNLAIATLGVGLMFDNLVFTNSALTGGFSGTTVGSPTLFGWQIGSFYEPWRYAVVTLVVASVAGVAVSNLRRSPSGRRLIAIRSNERAAASLGISVFEGKLYAFVVSAVLAGVAGVLLAFQNPNIVFSDFVSSQSLTLTLYAVLAGVGYILGGLLGGMLLAGGIVSYATQTLFGSNDLYQFIVGLLLVVTLVINPDGLAPSHYRQFAWIKGGILAPLLTYASILVLHRTSVVQGGELESGGGKPIVQLKVPPVKPVVPALTVRDLSVRFGGVTALNRVSFEVASGEILGLIGPNGAGKTTAIDAIAGFVSSYHGSISVGGVTVDRLSAAQRAERGLRRTFQSLELFDDLTVLENILIACQGHKRLDYLRNLVRPPQPQLTDLAEDAISEFALGPDLDRYPRELSFGKRRLVGIAQAVSVPVTAVLLDEPAAGLGLTESAELAELVRGFARSRGVGVLLVEHDFDLVTSICDRIAVLDFGNLLVEGRPQVIRNDERVKLAYLGAADVVASTEGARG